MCYISCTTWPAERSFGNPPGLAHIRKRSLAPESRFHFMILVKLNPRASQFRLTKLRAWLAWFNLYCRQQVGCVWLGSFAIQPPSDVVEPLWELFFQFVPPCLFKSRLTRLLCAPDGIWPPDGIRFNGSSRRKRGLPSLLDVSTWLKWRFSRRADLIY